MGRVLLLFKAMHLEVLENIHSMRSASRALEEFAELLDVHVRVPTINVKLARLVSLQDTHGRLQNRVVYLT